MKNKFIPKNFVLQWHITERCNWRCKHCYQENYATQEMDFNKLENALNQYIALVKKWKLHKQQSRIQITGGEPFLHHDLFKLLEKISKYSDCVNWGIMSNGSLLTEDIISRLKTLGIDFFQVSLEGTEKTNDRIRGKGSFQKIIAAIRLLNSGKIPVTVSLTLTKYNFFEIRELARLLATLNVERMAVRRIAPFGLGGTLLKNLVLEPNQLRSLYGEIEVINKELDDKKYLMKVVGGCENEIFNDEISSPGLMSYGTCGVTDGRILTLMPNGKIEICRRFPIKIGNVLEKSLEEIYYSSQYEKLRGENADAPLECYPCRNLKSCMGGAKCVTFALTGKTVPDVQCWKLFDNLDESISYIKYQNPIKKIILFAKIFRTYSR